MALGWRDRDSQISDLVMGWTEMPATEIGLDMVTVILFGVEK